MAQFENWGDYFWDDQIDECKRNKLDIHDATTLERQERSHTTERAIELELGAVSLPPVFDLERVKAIHAHVFHDVYEWAGQLRATELVRPAEDPGMPGHEFVVPEQIALLADTVFDQLGDPAELAGRPTGEVVAILARIYSGMNMLHPFVDGNGRTQRLFLSQAAEAGGHRIDWSAIEDRQNAVMAEAFSVGPEPVRQMLAQAVTRIEAGR